MEIETDTLFRRLFPPSLYNYLLINLCTHDCVNVGIGNTYRIFQENCNVHTSSHMLFCNVALPFFFFLLTYVYQQNLYRFLNPLVIFTLTRIRQSIIIWSFEPDIRMNGVLIRVGNRLPFPIHSLHSCIAYLFRISVLVKAIRCRIYS